MWNQTNMDMFVWNGCLWLMSWEDSVVYISLMLVILRLTKLGRTNIGHDLYFIDLFDCGYVW